jgi:hypothetical protein
MPDVCLATVAEDAGRVFGSSVDEDVRHVSDTVAGAEVGRVSDSVEAKDVGRGSNADAARPEKRVRFADAVGAKRPATVEAETLRTGTLGKLLGVFEVEDNLNARSALEMLARVERMRSASAASTCDASRADASQAKVLRETVPTSTVLEKQVMGRRMPEGACAMQRYSDNKPFWDTVDVERVFGNTLLECLWVWGEERSFCCVELRAAGWIQDFESGGPIVDEEHPENEWFETYQDEISGAMLDPEKVQEARRLEVEYVRKLRV